MTEMLRAALCAVAPQQSEEADASADAQPGVAARESWPAPHTDVVVEAIRERPTAPSAMSQVMKDMWTITIGGGLVVTVVGAVILKLIYG